LPVMPGLTSLLFVMGWAFKGPEQGPGRINRVKGGLLVLAHPACTAWLLRSLTPASA